MDSQSSGSASAHFLLRWEVGVVLVVKIVLVILIKIIFFGDPPGKAEVATRVADRLAGSAQSASPGMTPSSTQIREKP